MIVRKIQKIAIVQYLHIEMHQIKRLEIRDLYNKHFADETYNAHRALDDVVAMERLFTKTPLASLLSSLTIWSMQRLIQEWNVQRNNTIHLLVR